MEYAISDVVSKLTTHNKKGPKKSSWSNRKWITGLDKEEIDFLIEETGKNPKKLLQELQHDTNFHSLVSTYEEKMAKDYISGLLGKQQQYTNEEQRAMKSAEAKLRKQEEKEKQKAINKQKQKEEAGKRIAKQAAKKEKERKEAESKAKLLKKLDLSAEQMKLLSVLIKK